MGAFGPMLLQGTLDWNNVLKGYHSFLQEAVSLILYSWDENMKQLSLLYLVSDAISDNILQKAQCLQWGFWIAYQNFWIDKQKLYRRHIKIFWILSLASHGCLNWTANMTILTPEESRCLVFFTRLTSLFKYTWKCLSLSIFIIRSHRWRHLKALRSLNISPFFQIVS